jgi:hypothetical protein
MGWRKMPSLDPVGEAGLDNDPQRSLYPAFYIWRTQ